MVQWSVLGGELQLKGKAHDWCAGSIAAENFLAGWRYEIQQPAETQKTHYYFEVMIQILIGQWSHMNASWALQVTFGIKVPTSESQFPSEICMRTMMVRVDSMTLLL